MPITEVPSFNQMGLQFPAGGSTLHFFTFSLEPELDSLVNIVIVRRHHHQLSLPYLLRHGQPGDTGLQPGLIILQQGGPQ